MRNVAVAALLFIGGCQQKEVVLPPVSYDDILLQGTALEAKGQGYRACESVGSNFETEGVPDSFRCRRDRPTVLMGIPVDGAEVWLTYPTAIGNGPPGPETLSFNGVTLPLGVVKIDPACEKTDPADPNVCAFDGSAPMAQFERKLIATGWTASHRYAERHYVKAGVLVTFRIEPTKGLVHVGNAFQGFPEEMLKEIATDPQATLRDPASERARVVESMARN